METPIIVALIAGGFAIIAPIITFVATKTYENRFFQRISSSRANAVVGTWKGHIDQVFGPGGKPLRAAIRFNLRVSGRKVEGEGTAEVPYAPGDIVTTKFVLDGGFLHERFLRVNYNPEDSTTIQFGSAILLLSNGNEGMDGRFVGYGLRTGEIIYGEISLRKEKAS